MDVVVDSVVDVVAVTVDVVVVVVVTTVPFNLAVSNDKHPPCWPAVSNDKHPPCWPRRYIRFVHTCVQVVTHTHTHAHTCIQVFTHTHTLRTHACTNIHTYIRTIS